MNEKANKQTFGIAILIVVFIVAGVGGYFLGVNQVQSQYKREQELNVILNRSDMEGMGEINGTIYVSGHKKPDSDTVGSSIGYAALLRSLGYDAQAVVFGPVNNETKFILHEAGLETPPLLEDASGCNMVLMDHGDYEQSADGMKDAFIVSIIDHHSDGTVNTGNQLVYDARPLGSTATIVWIRYRNYGITPEKAVAHVLLGSVLSDTSNLKTQTTTNADREAVKALSEMAGVTDVDAFYQGMYKALVSHEGMTDEEIFFSDYKEYKAGNFNYSIGCINVYEEQEANELAGKMKALMPETLKSTGMDMTFTQIGILREDKSITYLIPSDETAAEVLEQAYGDVATFDGTSYILSPGISRKKDLVPAITNILESYPKEF